MGENRMSTPITYYHAAAQEKPGGPHAGMYATPCTSYAYVQTMPYCYAMTLHSNATYMVDTVQAIESLRQAPKRQALIASMGYDLVAYRSPGSPYHGASGWGDDMAQYLVLDPAIVKAFSRVPTPEPASAPRSTTPVIKNLFHSTDTPFARFDDPNNIGFHFGTKKAALARHAAVNNTPDIRIETVKASDVDLWRARYANADVLSGPHDMLMHLMTRKLTHPKPGIEDIVRGLEDEELAGHARALSDKPDIPDYQQALRRATSSAQYQVIVNSKEHLSTPDADFAKAYQQAVSDRMMKRASLRMANPLTLPDLGLWHANDIIQALPVSNDIKKQGRQNASEQAKYAWCRNVLQEMGHDGIAYTNAVEDAGKLSYIALSHEQIHEHQPRLPALDEPTYDRAPSPTASVRPAI